MAGPFCTGEASRKGGQGEGVPALPRASGIWSRFPWALGKAWALHRGACLPAHQRKLQGHKAP